MEDTIRKWLEDKLEDLELVEGDLKKHVRTFVGIFRLSRQDLVQDIKEEQQYPQAVRRYMDAQYSLEDLRKSVFVFEFMKLTCLEKEEANRIVDELFAEWNLIAGENLKEEKEDLSQKRPLSQPTCRSEPVSRSELETSYRSAFPALPPKGNKPKVPSEPIHSFWEQRSPLRSNPSVQSSRNKIGAQGSLTDKAPTLVPKKIRIGGKENECSPACTEPKKKTGKSREVRSRRESSNSSSQSPKSSEDQYLEKLSRDLKIYLGVNGSGKEAAKEPTKKKEMESQSSAAPAPTSEEEKGISLNPFPEPSVWDPDYVTKYPLWGSSHWVEDSAWCTPPNQRSASEPHFAKQELRMEGCGLPNGTLTCSDSISSSPSPVQDADPPVVDNPSLALKSSGLGECSSDLDLSALVPANSTSITSSHFDCLFLTGSIWSNSHLAGEEWPASKLDIPTPQSMNLEQATSLSPMPEKAEQQACGCPSDVGHHADYTVDHNTQQRLDHDPGVYGQSNGAYVAYSSQPSADCWGHQQADSSYESAEEEATESELDHDSFGIRKFASTLEESSQNDWEGSLKDVQFSLKAYDLDNVRTQGLASLFEDSSHRSWEECIKDPESLFMDNDLSSSPHFTRHSSFAVSSQQSCCSCEGACNCQSVLPVKFSLGSGEEDGPDIVHFYHPQRASHSCMQASQNVMKSASDSNLGHESDHKSAFRKVSSISFPSLVWPCLAHVADLFDAPSEPRTTTTCLIEDASACQLEKIKKNSLRVINPELTKPAEPEETAVPDPSIFDHPDVYGGDCPEVVMAVPSYLLKESKETQTSHGDSEPGPSVLPSPPASPPQKPVYEEKRWKDLKPLSAEDMQRDLLHAAISAQKEGIPHSDLLDVAVLEGYDFADFQLMTETSASALVPQNQAVYVKDLEKAWLSESYRRLGKNKGRRPLHPNKPCSFYLEGCCYRFDCKFSHDIDTITCQFWEVGQCFKGDLCPFLHGYFGGFSASDGGEEFDISKEDFPELTKKDMRLNSAPASKKRKNKKNSIHRLQLPRGT
ncbi:hypothetical protein ACOMHN_036257 [Nucella lapillus]